MWKCNLIVSDSVDSAVTSAHVNKWEEGGINAECRRTERERERERQTDSHFLLLKTCKSIDLCGLVYSKIHAVCTCNKEAEDCVSLSRAWGPRQIITTTLNCRMRKPQATDGIWRAERARRKEQEGGWRTTNHYPCLDLLWLLFVACFFSLAG